MRAVESTGLPLITAEDHVPRYHFNVYDGVSDIDHEGQELAGWEEARLEAVRLSGKIIENNARRIALGPDWRMEITDENGLVLFRLDFTVAGFPARERPPSGSRH